jgi:Ca-activated chloride channel homolog
MSESIWNDPRITAYVLGELPEHERVEFETELRSNSELAAAVEEARSVTLQLEGLFAAEATATLDEQRRQTIMAKTQSSGGQLTIAPPAFKASKLPLTLLVIAAIVLLLFGLAPWVRKAGIDVTVAQIDEHDRAVQRTEAKSEVGQVEVAGEEAMHDSVVRDDMESRSMSPADQPGEMESEQPVAIRLPEQPTPTPAMVPPATAVAGGTVAAGTVASGADVSDMDGLGRSSEPELSQKRAIAVDSSSKTETESEMPESALAVAKRTRAVVIADTPVEYVPEGSRARSVVERMEAAGASAGVMDVEMQKLAPEPAGRQVDALRSTDFESEAAITNLSLLKKQSETMPLDDGIPSAEGRGPEIAGDRFDPLTDNSFKLADVEQLSTFSIDVDTASYSKTRDFLTRANQLPRPDAVRIEEFLNYFDYDYLPPANDDKHPFSAHAVVTSCPWNAQHRLARIALQGKTMSKAERPQCNLVFLLDTSGSMDEPNKLPLVIEGMHMLLKQLDNKDRVAITVYAGSAGLVLDSTPAKKKKKIQTALSELKAGGSTNGGAGIALAYATARDNFISDGVNRVILCTDGDFNVGVTGTDSLVRMVEQEAKGGIHLSVLGFGMGNHNDAMLEQISGRGNGNYAFIDTPNEARKVLVDQTNATLVTIAKDVKLQVEFNPKLVSAYRLIGYENRVLAKEDFNDDKTGAGEIGAGHAVTALYEIIPVGVDSKLIPPKVDELKYQKQPEPSAAADSGEMFTLKLRYKAPDSDVSTPFDISVKDTGGDFKDADAEVRFAAAVAGFGMQLRRSEYTGNWTMQDVIQTAEAAKGEDPFDLRAEFVELARKAAQLLGQPAEQPQESLR